MKTPLLLFLIALPAGVLALPPATVQTLQSPAWVKRQNTTAPLKPGQSLDSGDRIVTGQRARVVLKLAEGSLVKLGADAELDLQQLQAPPEPSGLFEGFLDVVRGAFRFTTTVVGRKRNISARIRSATIGIRGTDVWGKSEPSRDFAVLLEGRVEIERDGQTYTLDEPLSLFMAQRGQPPEPIAPVDGDDLARWAQETEPQAGEGVRSDDGGYAVHLASYTSEAGGAALVARLGEAGFDGNLAPVTVDGRSWWRVSIPGFATRADADHTAATLGARFELGSPWIESR